MKRIAIIIFDQFTDIDLFLMWDILGRNTTDWRVSLLGAKPEHQSAHGLPVQTHGHLCEASDADAVLFCSGKVGVKAFLADEANIRALSLDPARQLIGSICAGAFILARLGLLGKGPATTHPDAQQELASCGIHVVDQALVSNGRVATAGGCLSALYLTGWLIETLFGPDKRKEALRELLPAGQRELYERLIQSSIDEAVGVAKQLRADARSSARQGTTPADLS